MIAIKNTNKRTIQFSNILVKESKFVDETGDITKDIIDALPPGVDTLNFKITVELEEPDEYLDLE